MSEAQVNLDAEREIRITREYDAPRELVWKALTDPAQVEIWWGPDGFTNTTEKIDIRTGGSWVFTMHGPDGKDWPNVITYREVVKPEKLTFRHGENETENPDEDFYSEITLEARGNKTLLTMRSVFASKAARDFVIREVHAIEGGKQTLQKLADHLERMTAT